MGTHWCMYSKRCRKETIVYFVLLYISREELFLSFWCIWTTLLHLCVQLESGNSSQQELYATDSVYITNSIYTTVYTYRVTIPIKKNLSSFCSLRYPLYFLNLCPLKL